MYRRLRAQPRRAFVFVACVFASAALASAQASDSVPSPESLQGGHAGMVGWLGLSRDDKLLAAADDSGKVTLWDFQKRTLSATIQACPKNLWSMALSDDGKYVAVGGSGGAIGVWDVKSRERLCSIEAHSGAVMNLGFSEDGRFLVSTASNGPQGDDAAVWEMPTGKERVHFGPPNRGIFSLLVLPGQDVILTGGDDADGEGEIKLWKLPDAKPLGKFPGKIDLPNALALSPDRKRLASSSVGGGSLRLWEVSKQKVLTSVVDHDIVFGEVAFSADSRYLVSASIRDHLKVWDTSDLRLVWTYHDSNRRLVTPIFSHDGKCLVVGTETVKYDSTDERPILVWDWEKLVKSFPKEGPPK